VIFGAAALGEVDQREADAALGLLLEHGVNHIDTAASYGESEVRLRSWLRHHRADFFLATKTDQRTYAGAHEQIRRSLERMDVAQVDLIQLHCLVHPAEWDTAFGDDGALRALVEARDEGLARFIGVTGHGLTVAEMHCRSLDRFPFDSVLFPYSHLLVQDEVYARDVDRLMLVCRTRGVAMQTIKGVARGAWGSTERYAGTWYEPLHEQAHIDLAVQWILGEPDVFLNSPGDLGLLPRVLDAAMRLDERPPDSRLAALEVELRAEPLFY
jgi:aryl-alcohol dehydrogenase-like predicted oxidoreductase